MCKDRKNRFFDFPYVAAIVGSPICLHVAYIDGIKMTYQQLVPPKNKKCVISAILPFALLGPLGDAENRARVIFLGIGNGFYKCIT